MNGRDEEMDGCGENEVDDKITVVEVEVVDALIVDG